MAGLTNTFAYKGFDLSFMFQGSFGGEIVNQNYRYSGFWNNGRNMYAGVANRWRSEANPGDGEHFRATLGLTGLQDQFHSLWVEDASFVRLKNIRVSYSLPNSLLAKTPIKSARIYVNAENVSFGVITPTMTQKTRPTMPLPIRVKQMVIRQTA